MLRTRLTLDLCMLPLPSLSVQIYLFLSPLKNNLIKLQCLTILDLKKIDLFSFIFTVYHCLRLEPNIIKCERNMILLHFHLKIPEDKQKQARGEYKQMNGEEQMKVRQFALLRSRQQLHACPRILSTSLLICASFNVTAGGTESIVFRQRNVGAQGLRSCSTAVQLNTDVE